MSTAGESDQESELHSSEGDSQSASSWGPVDLAELASQLTELTEELSIFVNDMHDGRDRAVPSKQGPKEIKPLGKVVDLSAGGCTLNSSPILTRAQLPRLSQASISRTPTQRQLTSSSATRYVTGSLTGQPSRDSKYRCVSKTGPFTPLNTTGLSYRKNTRTRQSQQTSSGTLASQAIGTSTSQPTKPTQPGITGGASMASTKTSST